MEVLSGTRMARSLLSSTSASPLVVLAVSSIDSDLRRFHHLRAERPTTTTNT